MTQKEKSTILEQISTLYLRLNGYFTTGFIVHSEDNRIEAEIDIMAVRFPKHNQDYTHHNSSEFLEVPINIDCIIAEIKSKGQKLQFNKSLRNETYNEPLMKMLQWIGLFDNSQIRIIASELRSLIQPMENTHKSTLQTTNIISTEFGNVTIRPILFCPERIDINNADKFINWSEINDFIWSCLCPSEERVECGTRYDLTSWGQGLDEIVKVYKDRCDSQNRFGKIIELYNDISTYRKNHRDS